MKDQKSTFRKLKEICSINPPLGVKVEPDTLVSFLPMEDVAENGGRIGYQARQRSQIALGLTAFRNDDILIAKITPCFENEKGWLANGLEAGVGFGSTELHVIRCGKEILPRFVYAHTLLPQFRLRGKRYMTGSAGQQRVPASFLNDYVIWVPDLQLQSAICRVDVAYERSLLTFDRLIAAKREQKRGLMQQLLTGKLRFPGFTEPWKTVRLGDVLKESRLLGTTGFTAKKITVKLYGRGVYAKQEKRTGSVNTRYFKRLSGQLIYSKLDFLNGAFGIVPDELDGFESTLDMPTFDIFSSANPHWLLALVGRRDFYQRFNDGAEGGRKAKRVDPSRFFDEVIQLPCRAEQDRIARLIIILGKEIELLAQQRAAFAAQRRGLMEKLLSGEIDIQNPKETAA